MMMLRTPLTYSAPSRPLGPPLVPLSTSAPYGTDPHGSWLQQQRPSWQFLNGQPNSYDQLHHAASYAYELEAEFFQNYGGKIAPVNTADQTWLEAPFLMDEPDQILLVNTLSSGACDRLRADAAEADTVAIDVEWAPDFRPGSDNPISVIQLAFPKSRRVYVLQVGRMGGRLPLEVQMMLVNHEVTKVGFAVDASDMGKFATSGIAVTRGSVLDMQESCTSTLGSERPIGLKCAASAFLGFVMDKSKRLVCSDWSSHELTPKQIRYAALDAWVTLRLYYTICCM
jgi:hypothetical protein